MTTWTPYIPGIPVIRQGMRLTYWNFVDRGMVEVRVAEVSPDGNLTLVYLSPASKKGHSSSLYTRLDFIDPRRKCMVAYPLCPKEIL